MDDWMNLPVIVTPPTPTPGGQPDWMGLPPVQTGMGFDDLAPKETPPKQGSPSTMTDQAWEFVKHLVSASPVGQIAATSQPLVNALSQSPAKTGGDVLDATHAAMLSNQKIYDEAKDALSKGKYGDAAVKGLYYLLNGIPGLGSSLNQSGTDLNKGQIGAGLGTAIGLGMSMAAPEVLKHEVLPAVETAMTTWKKPTPPSTTQFSMDLNRAIPPTKGAPYTQSDVTRAAPYLASEHASAPIETVDALRGAADSAVTQIEEQVGRYIDLHPSDLIRTDPSAAAMTALKKGARASDVAIGMKELSDLGLDGPITVKQADAIRRRLNAENDAIMSKNNYDRANARAADPGFVAREAATQALRDGVYNQLEDRGIQGVKQLRMDEGAVMSVRDAAQYHYYNADKSVAGTGSNSIPAKVARIVVPTTSAAIGAHYGGTLGAATGAVLGDRLTAAVTPANLTRDALIGRAFKALKVPPPEYPFVPPEPEIRGLLNKPPTVTPLPPDASGDSSFTGFYQPVQKRLPGAPITEPVPTEPSMQQIPGRPGFTAVAPDRSGSLPDLPTRSVVVRDPKTGRFKRVYYTDVENWNK